MLIRASPSYGLMIGCWAATRRSTQRRAAQKYSGTAFYCVLFVYVECKKTPGATNGIGSFFTVV